VTLGIGEASSMLAEGTTAAKTLLPFVQMPLG